MAFPTNSPFGTRTQGRRKSQFPAQTSVLADATFDYVSNGVNYKITYNDLLLSLGATGTLEPGGNSLATPILDVQGQQNTIRNLEDGIGITSSVSPENGISISINAVQDDTGAPVFEQDDVDPTLLRFASLVAGDGVQVTRQGDEIQISATGELPVTKTVTVNSEDDFPQAIGGVITLEPDTAYLISNNVTTNSRFVMGSNTAIVGNNPFGALLTSTTSGDMFTSVSNNNYFGEVKLSCPNGSVFNLSATFALPSIQIIFDVVIVTCNAVGSFNNLGGLDLSKLYIFNSNQGMVFTGSDWEQISLSQVFDNSTVDNHISVDLGTCVTNGVFITRLSTSSSGLNCFGIRGAVNSGNINPNSFGVISECNFRGTAQAVTGFDPSTENRWQAVSNDQIPDTRPDGLLSFILNGAVTVISAPLTPVLVNAVWNIDDENQFEGDVNGRLTYRGERPFRAPIDFWGTLIKTQGGTDQYSVFIAINGAVVSTTGVSQELTPGGDPFNVTTGWQYEFNEGDYVEVFVSNVTGTDNVIVEQGVLRVN